MILSPLFDHRFSWDLVFIIDLIFSAVIFFPLMASIYWKRKARWICRGSLIGLVLYILFCGVQHDRAIELMRSFAKILNEDVIQVASLPQPVSPFRWANYVETRDKVYQGFVDLSLKESYRSVSRQTEFRSNISLLLRTLESLYQTPGRIHFQPYQKLQDSPWVEKALATESVKFYYWFAQFPVVRSIDSTNGRHRVEFMDLRFLIPGIRLPFVYYVEFDASGRIRSEGFEDSRGQ
jgi:hypothetical protein